MANLSQRSLGNLAECDERLQKIAQAAIAEIDFTVIVGHRSEEDQLKAFNEGRSKLKFGNHNYSPSKAFDFIPYPFSDADWKDTERFREIAKVLCRKAAELGIPVRWGGTWSDNPNDPPAHFSDADHFEIHEKG